MEKRPRALADGRGEDRRVDAEEVALVEEVVDPLLELTAHRRDRALPRRAQPEVAVVEQKVDPVLLRLDRIVERARADDREIGDTELVATRRTRVGAHLTGDGNRGLERELGETFPHLLRHGGLDQHALQESGAITAARGTPPFPTSGPW